MENTLKVLKRIQGMHGKYFSVHMEKTADLGLFVVYKIVSEYAESTEMY
jgi:hypothetical protein